MTTTNDAPAPAPSGSGVREALEKLRTIANDAGWHAEYRRGLFDAITAVSVALASDASPRGEASQPVYISGTTLKYLLDGTRLASVYVSATPTMDNPVALYAHPAPATVESVAKVRKEMRDCILGLTVALPSQVAEWRQLLAALAPATEGRKG